MRRSRDAAALAVFGALIAAPAASGQIVAPTVTPDAGTSTEEVTAVRVLQAPAAVGAPALRQLADELALAPNGPVVVLVPSAATLDLDANDQALTDLASAAQENELVLVVQPPGVPAGDGAAALLAVFADARFLQDGARALPADGGAAWRAATALAPCDDACSDALPIGAATDALDLDGAETALAGDLDGSRESIDAALGAPAPDDGGGAAVVPALLALLLVPAAGVALVIRRSRRRRSAPDDDVPGDPPPDPPREPGPREPRPRPVPARGAARDNRRRWSASSTPRATWSSTAASGASAGRRTRRRPRAPGTGSTSKIDKDGCGRSHASRGRVRPSAEAPERTEPEP